MRSNIKRLQQLMDTGVWLLRVFLSVMLSTPRQTASFFTGTAPIKDIQHVSSGHLTGFTELNAHTLDKLTAAANQTQNGIVTAWFGIFLFVVVTRNQSRLALLDESKSGITNADGERFLQFIAKGNNVMRGFPVFQRNDQSVYQGLRQFLLRKYHSHAGDWLLFISTAAQDFVRGQLKTNQSYPIRSLVTLIVLNVSSGLLGLKNKPLTDFYETYQDEMNDIAQYGISEAYNPDYEARLFALFVGIFSENFESIQEDSLLRETLSVYGVLSLIESKEDFFKLDASLQHRIAMTYLSIALGGMAHSTINTLDWAVATIFKDPVLFKKLQAAAQVADLNQLSVPSTFDQKDSPLFCVASTVLYNVFCHPPFADEFFYVGARQKKSIDQRALSLVPGMILLLNYRACNQNEHLSQDTYESEILQDKDVVTQARSNPRNAAFGGSNSAKSRRCPAAVTSIYEQIILIAVLLKLVKFKYEPREISLSTSSAFFPLHVRENKGTVVIERNHAMSQ